MRQYDLIKDSLGPFLHIQLELEEKTSKLLHGLEKAFLDQERMKAHEEEHREEKRREEGERIDCSWASGSALKII